MFLPFKKVIGVVGGGQLGKMLIEASRPWNLRYHILENDPHCPSAHLSEKLIHGSLMDPAKIKELAAGVDIMTYEIEHIHVYALQELEDSGMEVIPSPRILNMIQDKGLQKHFYQGHGIPTAPFAVSDDPETFRDKLQAFPYENVVLKTRKGGYDGKGVLISTKTRLLSSELPADFRAPLIIEECISNAREISVIVARDRHGNVVSYPTIEMQFHPVANLVEFLFSPARLTEDEEFQARETAMSAVRKLPGPGLFAVEMFLDEKGRFLVNEMAPRPHNSGHHTIEACYTSQYEQLNRILAGYPLGNTDLIQPAAMINLLGPEEFSGPYRLANVDKLMNTKGLFIHLYNKAESRPHRKLGHITVMGDSLDEVEHMARKARELAQIVPI